MGKVFNFVSLGIMIAGLVAALVLVGTTQEFRERAGKEDMVTICHQTGSSDNPYQQIEVSGNAIQSHLAHGDSLSECPSDEPPAATDPPATDPPATDPPATDPPATEPPATEPPATETPGSGNGNGGGGNTTNNTTIINNIDNSSSSSSATAAPTQQVVQVVNTREAKFIFKIGFQSVRKKANDRIVKVSFNQEGNAVFLFNDVVVTSDENGVYTGEIEGVTAGTYDIIVKGQGTLARKFASVALVRGTNTWNWGATKLRAGDFDNNNALDILDLALILSQYTTLSQEVQDNYIFDVNGDGFFDTQDVLIVLTSYTELSVEGDS